jgi:hypothetical protein
MAKVIVAIGTEYRFILRDRAKQDIRHPVTGKVFEFPSYTAALRGRAMIDSTAHIIQQEKHHDQET